MKYSIIGTFVLIISIFQDASAQFGDASGARSISLGTVSTTFSDQYSVVNNPAGMSFIKQPMLGFSFDNRFLLMELSLKTLVATFPFRQSRLGLSLVQQGNANYNHLTAGVSCSRKLSSQLAVGVRCWFDRTVLSESYGNRFTPGCDLAMLLHPRENITFGVNIINPTRSFLSKSNPDALPVVIRTGLGYHFSPRLQLLAEISKQTGLPAQYHSGIEFDSGKAFAFRFGFSAYPFRYAFGVGINRGSWKIDIASSYHETLGISPSLSISYQL